VQQPAYRADSGTPRGSIKRLWPTIRLQNVIYRPDAPFTTTETVFLGALATHLNNESGECFVSVGRAAQETRLTPRAVQDVIHGLREHHPAPVVDIEQRRGLRDVYTFSLVRDIEAAIAARRDVRRACDPSRARGARCGQRMTTKKAELWTPTATWVAYAADMLRLDPHDMHAFCWPERSACVSRALETQVMDVAGLRWGQGIQPSAFYADVQQRWNPREFDATGDEFWLRRADEFRGRYAKAG
jgi:hypothetical protein